VAEFVTGILDFAMPNTGFQGNAAPGHFDAGLPNLMMLCEKLPEFRDSQLNLAILVAFTLGRAGNRTWTRTCSCSYVALTTVDMETDDLKISTRMAAQLQSCADGKTAFQRELATLQDIAHGACFCSVVDWRAINHLLCSSRPARVNCSSGKCRHLHGKRACAHLDLKAAVSTDVD
jgi:hypothetical protein